MFNRGRTVRTLAPRAADVAGEAKRAAAEKDEWVVNAFVPHEHRVTTAEAVAATVPFILAMDLAVCRDLSRGDSVRALAPGDGYWRSEGE